MILDKQNALLENSDSNLFQKYLDKLELAYS